MASMWQRLFGSPDKTAHRAPAPRATAIRVPAPANTDAARPDMSRAEVEDRFHRFVLELPERKIESITASEKAMLKRLKMLSVRFDIQTLPRLPSVLPQLLRTLRSEDTAGDELAKLVGRDPMIVGEIMRVTSSVYYRSAQPITSLRQAVVLLGQDGLRQVLTQHVMKPLLQSTTGSLAHSSGNRLWEHAERCASACAWFGKISGCEPFEAYLAGIICHTGTGAVIRLLDQLMPSVTEPISLEFLADCERLAAQLSLRAARYWELPRHVVEAMEDGLTSGRPPVTALGKALSMADSLAMTQLLVEYGRLAADLDLSQSQPALYPAAQIDRCQQYLRDSFSVAADA
jgi:HD-like signal output (HDOD) protein